MRTTLTLDSDVAHFLKERAKLEEKSFKELVNELLRRGMDRQDSKRSDHQPFCVKPHSGGFRPGVDLLKLNQLSDDLEADDFADEVTRSGAE